MDSNALRMALTCTCALCKCCSVPVLVAVAGGSVAAAAAVATRLRRTGASVAEQRGVMSEAGRGHLWPGYRGGDSLPARSCMQRSLCSTAACWRSSKSEFHSCSDANRYCALNIVCGSLAASQPRVTLSATDTAAPLALQVERRCRSSAAAVKAESRSADHELTAAVLSCHSHDGRCFGSSADCESASWPAPQVRTQRKRQTHEDCAQLSCVGSRGDVVPTMQLSWQAHATRRVVWASSQRAAHLVHKLLDHNIR